MCVAMTHILSPLHFHHARSVAPFFFYILINADDHSHKVSIHSPKQMQALSYFIYTNFLQTCLHRLQDKYTIKYM